MKTHRRNTQPTPETPVLSKEVKDKLLYLEWLYVHKAWQHTSCWWENWGKPPTSTFYSHMGQEHCVCLPTWRGETDVSSVQYGDDTHSYTLFCVEMRATCILLPTWRWETHVHSIQYGDDTLMHVYFSVWRWETHVSTSSTWAKMLCVYFFSWGWKQCMFPISHGYDSDIHPPFHTTRCAELSCDSIVNFQLGWQPELLGEFQLFLSKSKTKKHS